MFASFLIQWKKCYLTLCLYLVKKKYSFTLCLQVLRLSVVNKEFGKLFQIIEAIEEILFWPWLVLSKCCFNFRKDALVVVLGWPAGLNTLFIYGGLMLLQNFNNIELIICFKQSLMGSQVISLSSGAALESYKAIYEDVETRTCFFV